MNLLGFFDKNSYICKRKHIIDYQLYIFIG